MAILILNNSIRAATFYLPDEEVFLLILMSNQEQELTRLRDEIGKLVTPL